MDKMLEIINGFQEFKYEEMIEKVIAIGMLVAWKIILVALVYMTCKIIVSLGNKAICGVMRKNRKMDNKALTNISNFETMLITIFKYTVYIIGILTVLTNVLGILDLSTVLATVGVGGIALSFGAQVLVKDIISGFFILLEGQMGVGELVTIGSITGTVKELDLRCVKVLTFKGETVFVPYGEIRQLINQSKEDSSVIIDIPVSYDKDLDKLLVVAKEVVKAYKNENITEKMEVLSPIEMDSRFYKVRVIGKAKPLCHWEIERDLRKQIIEKANTAGIVLGSKIELN